MHTWLDVAFLDVRDRIHSVSGSPDKDEFVLKDVDGVMELVKVGSTNLYEYIQSHKDSVDINKILERYQNGDVSALDRVRAQYLDIVGAPETLAEMYSFVRNTAAYFESLPLEVREAYDHNVSNFVADIGSERFNKLFEVKASDLDVVKPDFNAKVMVNDKPESEVKLDA